MEVWPQQFLNKKCREMLEEFGALKTEVQRLKEELASLDQRKQDRKGRKRVTSAPEQTDDNP